MSLTHKAEYASWLGDYRWEWFCTLTLREGIGRKAAIRKLKFWIEELEEREGGKITWFRVAERGEEGGHFHFHVIVGGVRRTPIAIAECLWERWAGSADIDEYDYERNGIGYMLKQLEEGNDLDWDADLQPRDKKA